MTTTALTGTALGTFSVAGNMATSTMNVGASVTSFTVSQVLSSPLLPNGNRTPGDSIAAGFNPTSSIGTLTVANISGLDLVTNSLKTMSVKGNATAALSGAIANSLFTVVGGVGKVGIGTATVTGTVSNTDFDVFNGNVTTISVGAFTSSGFWVGFHAVAANDIDTPLALGAGTWNTAISRSARSHHRCRDERDHAAGRHFHRQPGGRRQARHGNPAGINTTIPAGSRAFTFGLGFRHHRHGNGHHRRHARNPDSICRSRTSTFCRDWPASDDLIKRWAARSLAAQPASSLGLHRPEAGLPGALGDLLPPAAAPGRLADALRSLVPKAVPLVAGSQAAW